MAKRFCVYRKDQIDPVIVYADVAVVKGDSLVLKHGNEEVAGFAFSGITAWKSEGPPETELDT
jgi:hypothetical protein